MLIYAPQHTCSCGDSPRCTILCRLPCRSHKPRFDIAPLALSAEFMIDAVGEQELRVLLQTDDKHVCTKGERTNGAYLQSGEGLQACTCGDRPVPQTTCFTGTMLLLGPRAVPLKNVTWREAEHDKSAKPWRITRSLRHSRGCRSAGYVDVRATA